MHVEVGDQIWQRWDESIVVHVSEPFGLRRAVVEERFQDAEVAFGECELVGGNSEIETHGTDFFLNSEVVVCWWSEHVELRISTVQPVSELRQAVLQSTDICCHTK